MLFLTSKELSTPLNCSISIPLVPDETDETKTLSIRIYSDQEEINDDKIFLDIGIIKSTPHGSYSEYSWNLTTHTAYLRDISRDVWQRSKQVITEHGTYCIERYKNKFFLFLNYLENLNVFRVTAVRYRLEDGTELFDPFPNDLNDLLYSSTDNSYISFSKRHFKTFITELEKLSDELNRYYYLLMYVFPGFGRHEEVEFKND